MDKRFESGWINALRVPPAGIEPATRGAGIACDAGFQAVAALLLRPSNPA
jgi:hypothetical protein